MASFAPGTVRSFGRPNDNFTMLSNTFLRMPISPRAFRVAAFVLSHSADYAITQKGIARALALGLSTVAEALRDLEAAGLLIRQQARNARGHRLADQLLISQEPFTVEQREALTLESNDGAQVSELDSPYLDSEYAESNAPKKNNSMKKINPLEEKILPNADASSELPLPGLPSPAEKRKEGKPVTAELDAEFAEWWAIWPKRVGRGQALTAYRSARRTTGVTAAELSAGASAVATRWASTPKHERQYIPYPATWLNGQRWTDDAAALDAGAASGMGTVARTTDWAAYDAAGVNADGWDAVDAALIAKHADPSALWAAPTA